MHEAVRIFLRRTRFRMPLPCRGRLSVGPIRGLEAPCTARKRLPIVIDAHFIPVKHGLLVPSAPIEFGLQRALVRALVHDPRDASWNHSTGDDKDSGGREVQPRATPLLLRLSFVRQADRHLVASQDHAPLLKANSLANSILNRDRAKS